LFVDGNKRVAVTVTAAFLKVNGYQLQFDDMEASPSLLDSTKPARFGSRNLSFGYANTLLPVLLESEHGQ
jgi:hypothetical protein